VFSGTAANTFDKVRLTFDEALAPSSFTTADAVLKFGGTDISGQITGVTAVSGSGDKQFDITFASQSAIGTYSMIVGPDITNVSGNLMNQNGNATNGENPGDQFTATGTISTITTFNSTDVNKTIVDFATTTSVLNVGQNLTIGKITVKMNLNHTWDSDLKISLRSPAGTTVLLTNRRGGSGDNYATTIFDSSAATSIASGVAPFNGTFRPESSLTAFNGQSTSGTWTLTIQDLARLDSGRLNSWSITVTPAGGGTAAAFSDGAGASAGVVAGSAGKHDVPVLMFATPAPTFAPLADVAPSHMQDNPLFQSPSLSENLLYQAREDRAAATGFVETTAVPSNETTSTIGDWLNYDSNDVLNSRI
jgi:serine protease